MINKLNYNFEIIKTLQGKENINYELFNIFFETLWSLATIQKSNKIIYTHSKKLIRLGFGEAVKQFFEQINYFDDKNKKDYYYSLFATIVKNIILTRDGNSEISRANLKESIQYDLLENYAE